VIGADERSGAVRADLPPAWRRRKAVIVTNSLPGHDAGFAKSGHAHYFAGIIANLLERGFDTVLVVVAPRLDCLWLDAGALPYRIASPALRRAGSRLIVTAPDAIRSALAWLVFTRLPRPLQALGSGARVLFRKARGYVHRLGTRMADADTGFVARTIQRERPDIIVYDGIFNACGRHGDAQHWVLTHEVKYQRAQSFHENGIAVAPAGFSREAECAVLAEAGNIIAIQWDDAQEFRRLTPQCQVVVVPVTMNVRPDQDRRDVIPGRCIFVGSGSFHNVNGIRWFLASCWPGIRQAQPHATLDIFGTVCYRLGDLPKGVTAHGVAPDLAAAYAHAALAVVPLRIGSGLKVKLIEALAHGIPVVTTPVGAQGLSGFLPRPFLLADSATEFVAQCARLIASPDLARDISSAARQCAQRFTPQSAFTDFIAATEAQVTPDATPAIRICIAIPTFRRLDLLPNVLAGIAKQTVGARSAVLDVVILDNNPDGAAAPLAALSRAEFPFPLHYEHVAAAGLTAVRNRALDFVAGRFDYLAMIDDDEVPEPQWIDELVRVARRTRAEVVVGPVVPIVPPGAPQWIVDLRAAETPLHPDGALLRDGWSCNALVAVPAIAALGVRFDPALNFAGGEDQLFFRQMLAAGATIAFAAGATVCETIPPDRLSLRFNLKRAFRRGNTLAFCDLRMKGGPAAAALRGLKALATIVRGMASIPVGLVRGERALVRYSCDVVTGVGMLAGLAGRMYPAYQRSD